MIWLFFFIKQAMQISKMQRTVDALVDDCEKFLKWFKQIDQDVDVLKQIVTLIEKKDKKIKPA